MRANGEVIALLDEIDRTVRHAQVDPHLGEEPDETGKDQRQSRLGSCDGARHADRTAGLGRSAPHGLLGGRRFGQHGRGAIEELSANVRQHELSRRAMDQPRPEIVLKLCNAVADAGFGTAEGSSRAGKAALLSHLHQKTGIVQVDQIVHLHGRSVRFRASSYRIVQILGEIAQGYKARSAVNPGMRTAGAAGIVAAGLLVAETSSFLVSGWSPARFADPGQAMGLIQEGGGALRLAALFGFAGLVATVYLLAGLASALAEESPGAATGLLYLGLVGVAGHSLVPLTLWIGVPAFLQLKAQNVALAKSGWAAFAPISNGAHGIGALFMGCAMLLAGGALVRKPGWMRAAGAAGLAAGLLTIATLLVVGTPLETSAGLIFLPSLGLTVLFRISSGIALWRLARDATPARA